MVDRPKVLKVSMATDVQDYFKSGCPFGFWQVLASSIWRSEWIFLILICINWNDFEDGDIRVLFELKSALDIKSHKTSYLQFCVHDSALAKIDLFLDNELSEEEFIITWKSRLMLTVAVSSHLEVHLDGDIRP